MLGQKVLLLLHYLKDNNENVSFPGFHATSSTTTTTSTNKQHISTSKMLVYSEQPYQLKTGRHQPASKVLSQAGKMSNYCHTQLVSQSVHRRTSQLRVVTCMDFQISLLPSLAHFEIGQSTSKLGGERGCLFSLASNKPRKRGRGREKERERKRFSLSRL